MGAFVMAWLVGDGIIIYRSVKQIKGPPGPGQLLISSGVFALLALLAEADKLRTLAVTMAWGFDAAAFMNVFGVGTPKQSGTTWQPSMAPNTTLLPSGGVYAPMGSQPIIPPGASNPTNNNNPTLNA